MRFSLKDSHNLFIYSGKFTQRRKIRYAFLLCSAKIKKGGQIREKEVVTSTNMM